MEGEENGEKKQTLGVFCAPGHTQIKLVMGGRREKQVKLLYYQTMPE